MNEKFCPMSEIAEAAGISKALLFHYFHNKKELYREMYWASEGYLWEKVQQGGAMDIDQICPPRKDKCPSSLLKEQPLHYRAAATASRTSFISTVGSNRAMT